MSVLTTLLSGDETLTAKQLKDIRRGWNVIWRALGQEKKLYAGLRDVPDEQFEKVRAGIQAMPSHLRGLLAKGLTKLPHKKGGRPPAFPEETRLRAIQDLGHELPRTRTFSDAVDVVAVRYGMTPEYLRKIWKNRKRLQS